jgi:hypothetical protein
MQTPVFLSSPSRFKSFTGRKFHLAFATSVFDSRIVEVVRNLLLSSLLWALLAAAVYTVYAMIVGTH